MKEERELIPACLGLKLEQRSKFFKFILGDRTCLKFALVLQNGKTEFFFNRDVTVNNFRTES